MTHRTKGTLKHIVLFGETGVGKSSLVNLIAGRAIAATSNAAKGCTFQHKKYEFQVGETAYAIWDTPGLNEGTHGTIPARDAERNLKRLLHDLSTAGGVHLLVYCIRASRLRRSLLTNYNVFYSAICRKKVPIAVVVTGLENYEPGQMADWWASNGAEFEHLKMHFDGHACVTTLSADEDDARLVKERCHASRQVVLSLIAHTCAQSGWVAERESWTSAALTGVGAMSRPGTKPEATVALYDIPEHPLDLATSSNDASPFEGGLLMNVGGDPFLVYRVRDEHLRSGTQFRKQVALRDADLLIVCVSVHADAGLSRRIAATFHASYGGDMRPLLIVVKHALTDEEACEWWNGVDSHGRELEAAIICALPPAGNPEVCVVAVAKLRRTIQTRSLQPVDIVQAGCCGVLICGRRSAKLRSVSASTGSRNAWVGCCLMDSGVWSPWQGIGTTSNIRI